MTHLPPISETLPDAPPMPAFHQVRSLKAGPLTKQGSLFKSWKKRLFILQDAFLLYYVSPDDTSPRGALWIKECHVREETDVSRLQTAKTGSAVYCFSLQCYKSWNIEAKRTFRERTYLLLADSFQDMSDWMAILRTMARASADIDAEFEQSYLQAFASNDSFSTPASSAVASTNADGSDGGGGGGGMGAASAEPIGRHKRTKSVSTQARRAKHSHHGASAAAAAAATMTTDGTGSSGGSSTGSLARPRTPLASSSTYSLSSSAGTSFSAAAAAAPSMVYGQARDRDRSGAAGASSSSSSFVQVGGGGGAGATSLRSGANGGGGGGGASMSGGTGVSFSSGPADTPRASVSHSLSDSLSSSLTHNSVTQRRRADSGDAELQLLEHMLPMHIGGSGGGGGGVARPAQPIGLAANKGSFAPFTTSPPTAAHSFSSLQSPHSRTSSHSSSLVEGDTDHPPRSLTPLAGQQQSLTPRRKHTAVALAVAQH